MSKPNIRDIAKRCGVGVSTVSRVINGSPYVKAETREAVLKEIAESGYVPNDSARNLKRTSSAVIGVLVKGVTNPFYARMISVYEERLAEAGYIMLLRHVPITQDEIDIAVVVSLEKRMQGLIFLGGRTNHTAESLSRLTIPFVFVTVPFISQGLEGSNFSFVSIDDIAESRRAVTHLIKMGHRKIAIVAASKQDKAISEQRYIGYRQALADHGLSYNPEIAAVTGSFSMPTVYRTCLKLIKKNSDFTAIFAICDTMAVAAIRALADNGLRVPEDVSVISIDGLELGQYTVPALTTLRQPDLQMAQRSVDILLDLMGGHGAHRQEVFKAQLVDGASAALREEKV